MFYQDYSPDYWEVAWLFTKDELVDLILARNEEDIRYILRKLLEQLKNEKGEETYAKLLELVS